MPTRRNPIEPNRRRGAVIPFVAVCAIMLLSVAALTIDLGTLYRAREECQIAADAAALAGAPELLDEDRLRGAPDMSEEIVAATQQAIDYAERNPVLNTIVHPDPMTDISVGYLHDLSVLNEPLTFDNPDQFNTVMVRVRSPVEMSFAAVFGFHWSQAGAMAAAAFKDGVVGFKVTPETGNAGLLPFALHVDVWEGLLDGTWPSADDWSYDSDSDTVTLGSDGIAEVNLFMGGGAGQLPPGNMGTLDVGSSNNSTSDIARQILDGVNAEDLAWHGGELALEPDGTLELTGDTGISAGVKDELEAIIGLPRTIMLFDAVSGPGDNSVYIVVGFAGVRVVDVELTGPQNSKRVMIQPSFVVDDAAITGPGSGSSYFVYQPVLLVR